MNIKKILFTSLAVLVFILVAIAGYYFALRKNKPAAPPEAPLAQTAASSSASGMALGITDYCLGGQCWKENASSLFGELFGTVLDSIAPSSTSFYINPVVDDVYFDDSWNAACAPLKQKVAALVSGKTSVRDKILAITNWVAGSKPPGPSPAGVIQDICGLFGAHSGASADAAALTVAMLKSAGIPARIVYPSATNASSKYAYASVLLDGKWVGVDGNFGEGQRNIFNPTAFLESMTYKAFEKPMEIIISSGNKLSSDFTYYLADGIFTRTNVVNDIAAGSATSTGQAAPYGTITYIKPWYSVYGLDIVDYAELTAKDTQCDYYSCKKSVGTNTDIKLPEEYTMLKAQKIFQVAGGKVVQEVDKESVIPADLRKEYYVNAGFPPGNYRFSYRSSSGNLVAYYDFELKQGDNLTIMPDMLSKGDGADDTQFKGFIDYLRIASQ
ncbi:MAG TPA: transglutaminase-like domain-containing protein [Candidatus Paceibacterota bacterium]|nr:transglutaminase-like domain-containing protein [Candidatus Paceibacterota bacterium]